MIYGISIVRSAASYPDMISLMLMSLLRMVTGRAATISYEQSAGIEHINLQTGKPTPLPKSLTAIAEKIPEDLTPNYHSMSKEELIEELMKAKIREARLKKGYMVKGDGVEKEYILLDNKNTK